MKLRILILFGLWSISYALRADNYPKNYNIDILHYKFEINLSDDTDEIIARNSITVLFKKDGITQVRLDLVNQSDSLNGKGMKVESINQMDKVLNYVHAGNVLWITLDKPSVANTETEITIAYRGIPADGLRIGKTMHRDRSFFNENWPNRARHWLPTVDHPYEKASSEFIIKAPSHYQVISNGLLQEETMINADTKLTHWKQSVPVSCWLYVLGVAEFAVQYLDYFEGKSIQTWVYSKDRDAGFFDFAEPTNKVLHFFSDYIGPFVYEKLANVQTPSVNGGMETSSAIFYGEDLVTGRRDKRFRNIIIHELAHQWFGNSVTESSWDDAWLSEGFATYFTMLYIEHAYGREEFVDQLLSAKETSYNLLAKVPDYKIVDDRSPELTPVVNGLTYQKGAWILHMLRNLVGDQAFQAGIKDYYQRFINSHATTDDFRHAMERASGKDLKTFFSQWLYQGGAIKLKGTWHYDAEKKLILLQFQQTHDQQFQFDFRLELAVYHSGKIIPEISSHSFNSKRLELTLASETKPEKLILDPRTILLASWEFEERK